MAHSLKYLYAAIVVAAVLWYEMFSPWTSGNFNFWVMMSFSAVLLTSLALPFLRAHRVFFVWWRELLMGIGIAVLLWCVFWVGDKASSWMFDFARPQVDGIYNMKSGTPPWAIGLLLLFVIGPAEELFWRGFVQQRLWIRWGGNVAFVVTTLVYTLIHLWSFNFMLIMAAFTCGICWGLLYRLFPRHLPAIVISHALWDAAAFVWFPF